MSKSYADYRRLRNASDSPHASDGNLASGSGSGRMLDSFVGAGVLGSQLHAVQSWWSSFKRFVRQGPAVDLGVGIIIGGVFTELINSFMADIFTPPVGLLFGATLRNVFIVLRQGQTPDRVYNTLDEAHADGAVTENVGKFAQSMLNFFIVCLVLYGFIHMFQRIQRDLQDVEEARREEEAREKAARTGRCPECLEAVAQVATRCPHCTSRIPQAPPQ